MTNEPDPEVAALKQRVDELTEKLHDVHTEQQRRNQELVKTLRAFGLDGEQIEGAVRRGMNHGLTRRAALLGIVVSVGGAGYIAGTETARAVPTGQQGTAAEPIDIIYADEIGQSGDEVTNIFTDSVVAGNINLGDVTGNGLPSQAIEHGKVWADDGQLYTSVQSAVNAASSLVLVGPGTFSEAVSVSTANLSIIGSGRATLIDGGTTGAAISVGGADGVTIRDLAVSTTAGAGNSYNGLTDDSNDNQACVYENIWVEEADNNGIGFGGIGDVTEHRLISVWCDSANIDGNDVQIDTDNNVIDDIIGTVTDNGTGNVVGETA